ncbi:DUF4870 domain-containing protein [Verrucomicrobiaceae bacterium 5K15]|uniref:DUF4870 domain-containing protein n=1 Tax=Oceaniferula flava TaxID=2800421 RepID=A0AAE2VB15_9BACT|nr:DUF4870 domain-containing protein [Oceaniferula flavus]MBK1853995.1 DUF4870 domain-containing protein [Oceaniferula flavus]MBM1135301.1 DUF4870 domain-containing protein [Oceaniferula flavus]
MDRETSPQPPEMPSGSGADPYVTPAQPPMLPTAAQADANGVTADDRSMGMLVHLLGLLTGFIGVLIIWLVKKDQSRFVDFHGREALNFMITIFTVTMGGMLVGLALSIFTMGLGMLLLFPLIFLVGVGQLVCEIIACIAANRGEWHRYPMTIRFIPDRQ